MTFKNLFCAFALLCLSIFTGCAELLGDSKTEADGSLPAIQLQAPTENSVFTAGNSISIKSVISDKDQIKEMDVQLVKLSEGVASEAIWGYKKYPKTNPVIVDTAITSVNLSTGVYLLRFNLVDNRTNTQVKEVHFIVR